jgi:hypothetical protein
MRAKPPSTGVSGPAGLWLPGLGAKLLNPLSEAEAARPLAACTGTPPSLCCCWLLRRLSVATCGSDGWYPRPS